MYNLTKDKKLLIFKYKFLHRSITTNKTLNQWDRNKPIDQQRSANCTFCKKTEESIEHLFFDCNITKRLWKDILNWIYGKVGIRINFNKTEILLGTLPTELFIFNLIFLLGIKYIYYSRSKETSPNVYLLKHILKDTYYVEKEAATGNSRKENLFNLKWELLHDCFR